VSRNSLCLATPHVYLRMDRVRMQTRAELAELQRSEPTSLLGASKKTSQHTSRLGFCIPPFHPAPCNLAWHHGAINTLHSDDIVLNSIASLAWPWVCSGALALLPPKSAAIVRGRTLNSLIFRPNTVFQAPTTWTIHAIAQTLKGGRLPCLREFQIFASRQTTKPSGLNWVYCAILREPGQVTGSTHRAAGQAGTKQSLPRAQPNPRSSES
jgi:hypothetical protein